MHFILPYSEHKIVERLKNAQKIIIIITTTIVIIVLCKRNAFETKIQLIVYQMSPLSLLSPLLVPLSVKIMEKREEVRIKSDAHVVNKAYATVTMCM